MRPEIFTALVRLDTIEAVAAELGLTLEEVREALLEAGRHINTQTDFAGYKYISVHRKRLHGLPCLAGHRISVAQCLAEIEADADPQYIPQGITGKGSVREFVTDFDLEIEEVHGLLNDVAAYLINQCPRCQRAKAALQNWVDRQGHDRCWYYPEIFRELSEILGVQTTVTPELPPRAEFEQGCTRYQDEEYHGRSTDGSVVGRTAIPHSTGN